MSLALLLDLVELVRIRKFIGFYSISLNSGLFIELIIRGLILEKSGFNNVFITTFILITADLVLYLLVIELKHAERYRSP